MNEREACKYIAQLDEMIEWCKCEELKAHYKDEHSRVFKIYIQCIQERIKEHLFDN